MPSEQPFLQRQTKSLRSAVKMQNATQYYGVLANTLNDGAETSPRFFPLISCTDLLPLNDLICTEILKYLYFFLQSRDHNL
uniref:Uncharacterized protein n=1 Tax=Parascaris univalens TaxID=6257 RepID=A0A915A293_PARUN